MENANSQLPNQNMDEGKEIQLQKTIAQVEINHVHLDKQLLRNKLPPNFNMAASEQSINCITTRSVLNSAQAGNRIPERSNITNDAIELTYIESNGGKVETRGSRPSSQSPRTIPRAHASHRRQLHTDIHSASASPSIPSRNNHQHYIQGHANNNSPIAPHTVYGAKSSNPSVQSPAGVQSINSSDSPSLMYGQDSNESSCCGMGTTDRKEVLQQQVISQYRAISPSYNKEIL